MFVAEGGLDALISWFHVGVVTYSQVELLAGNPSENLCPVRGGQL